MTMWVCFCVFVYTLFCPSKTKSVINPVINLYEGEEVQFVSDCLNSIHMIIIHLPCVYFINIILFFFSLLFFSFYPAFGTLRHILCVLAYLAKKTDSVLPTTV